MEARLFWENIRALDDVDYLRALLTYIAAPTLYAGKPATLVTLTGGGRGLLHLWQAEGVTAFVPPSLSVCALRSTPENVTLLLYNAALLCAALHKPANRRFLARAGYRAGAALDEDLSLLRRRCANGCPHEIGLFLGIPLHDVHGFVKSGGRDCLCCRYWKVYKKPGRAIRTFARFDEAKRRAAAAIVRPGAWTDLSATA